MGREHCEVQPEATLGKIVVNVLCSLRSLVWHLGLQTRLLDVAFLYFFRLPLCAETTWLKLNLAL